MSPEVQFVLSSDAATRLDAILAEHGLEFVRLSRSREEILEPNHPLAMGLGSHEEFRGLLKFKGREFICSLRLHARSQRLEVNTKDLEDKTCEELLPILERAFPQPQRRMGPFPKPRREWDKEQIMSSVGCLAVLVVIFGTIALAIFGAVKLFR